MSSPPQPQYPRSPFRNPSFLLLQDEPPLAPKGHGALANLISERVNVVGDTDALGDDGRRSERRMSAILNAPNMRSMRLIGNSNPRWRWERYWKTEEELATMRKPVSVLPVHVSLLAFPSTHQPFAGESIMSVSTTWYSSISISTAS